MLEHLTLKDEREGMSHPADNVEVRDRSQGHTQRLDECRDFAPVTRSNDRFDLGEHHFNRIEVRAVRRQEEERACTLLNQQGDLFPMMGRQVVQHHQLPWSKFRKKDVADIPDKDITVYRALDDQRRRWPTGGHRAYQGLVLPPVPGDTPDRSSMTGRTSVAPRHRGVEPAFVQKDDLLGRSEVGREVIEELRAQFLIPFAGDQRFFYA